MRSTRTRRSASEIACAFEKVLTFEKVLPAFPRDEDIAQALFFAALACLRLAEADQQERARDMLAAALDAEVRRRRDAPPV